MMHIYVISNILYCSECGIISSETKNLPETNVCLPRKYREYIETKNEQRMILVKLKLLKKYISTNRNLKREATDQEKWPTEFNGT